MENFKGMLQFKELREDGKYNNHRVDKANNRFINGKCVNPKKSSMIRGDDGMLREVQIGEGFTPVSNPLPPVIKR